MTSREEQLEKNGILLYTEIQMAISKKDVKHIGELAQLKLSEKDLEKFRGELSSILDYIEKLQEVETEKVEPTYQTIDLINFFHEDDVEKNRELSQEEALASAPQKEEGYIKVKPVF